ncbi:MAG: bifunctional riboflavin kinase/FAD synthetase [Alphaproteobacteria bacterium]|jgi:riboflavin kinase/FMN adenylyltransferase|nr:bifunctional riboflavin kinase/FAD synthetase [Alphaproteobacteria bacterium]MDP6517096.1 bifunctional riboflavin kinase/FAD synthetase [Alphaproteobacteria bacterium]
MRIIRYVGDVSPEARGAVVALGNFDGVHLGHRGVIGHAAEIARQQDRPLAVLTFEPHPIKVLRPDLAPHRLAPFRVKVRRLGECGVDIMFVLRFTKAFSQRTAESFIEDVLAAGLGVGHVVVGHDYRFGRGRAGNHALLAEAGAKSGFGVSRVAQIGNAGEIYSSSRVRAYLQRGEPRLAAAILGHMWEVEARVLHGDKRGRTLGYPTANLHFDDHVEPALGIYAVWVGIVGPGGTEWHPAVASAGVRPTFDGKTVVLEVYLFDFEGDLYGRYLRVAFVNWIRPELKFDDIAELTRQMAEDCRNARFMLKGSSPPADVGRTPFNQ